MTEFVVHSARGEAVIRTSSECEAHRVQRVLGGRIDRVTTAAPEPALTLEEVQAA